MENASVELEQAIERVSIVITENLSASESLKENSRQVMESVENIASVSEENSAAVEEVSASTEEMSAQVAIDRIAQQGVGGGARVRAKVAELGGR